MWCSAGRGTLDSSKRRLATNVPSGVHVRSGWRTPYAVETVGDYGDKRAASSAEADPQDMSFLVVAEGHVLRGC
jgi:hypothetical protein